MEVPGEFRWVLTGIVSFGLSPVCDKAGEYTLFTNVGRYYKWIDTHTSFSDEEEYETLVNYHPMYRPHYAMVTNHSRAPCGVYFTKIRTILRRPYGTRPAAGRIVRFLIDF